MSSNGNDSFRGVSEHKSFTTVNSNKVIVSKLTANSAVVNTLKVGVDGTQIDSVKTGTLTINPVSIPATTRSTVSVALAGLQTTSRVILEPPSTLNSGLLYVGHECATNQINIFLYNKTGGAIDDGPVVWKYLFFDLNA